MLKAGVCVSWNIPSAHTLECSPSIIRGVIFFPPFVYREILPVGCSPGRPQQPFHTRSYPEFFFFILHNILTLFK